MTSEEKALCFWSVLVITFFGCMAAVIGIGDSESVVAQCCMRVALILAVPLAIRFRWFRIMLCCFFLLWLLLVWGTNKKKRD